MTPRPPRLWWMLVALLGCESEPAAPTATSASATSTASASSAPAASASGGLEGLLNKGAGCPCGCDRSEAMADELRETGGEAAAQRIASSLATIAERERAGYITEAMVEHRLRLRALAEERGHATVAPRPPVSVQGPTRRFEDVAVVTELIVHGDTVEQVAGKPKPLKACFLWRMELENLSDEALELPPPTVEANVPLPVSRWYLAGTDGAPWHGSLPPGAKQRVNVIGYSGAPIAPGTVVQASLRVGKHALTARAVARSRWNEPVAR